MAAGGARLTPVTRPPLTSSQRLLATGLVLGVTLVAFEVTAVVTAMPTIADDLDGDSLFGLAAAVYTLANLVATVAAGELADRRGAVVPYAWSIATFVVGLVVAAVAPSMVWIVIGRTLQGAGTGAFAPIGYVLVKRAFPDEWHATMFAVLSAGWVLPSLFAPAISGVVVDILGWRWAFLMIVPAALAVGALAIGPMRAYPPTLTERRRSQVPVAALAALGVGAWATGVQMEDPVAATVVAVAGAVVAWRGLRRLLPAGWTRAAAGLPALILCRFLATAAFMGVDSFVPLAASRVHGASPTVQGFVIIGAALFWTVGQWIRARWPRPDHRRAIREGFVILAFGIVLATPVLWDGWPLALVFAGWSVGGLGMGLLFNPSTMASTAYATDGSEGRISSQVSLADSLGFSVMGGLGGGAVALAEHTSATLRGSLLVTFAIAACLAVAGGAAASRSGRSVGDHAA